VGAVQLAQAADKSITVAKGGDAAYSQIILGNRILCNTEVTSRTLLNLLLEKKTSAVFLLRPRCGMFSRVFTYLFA